MTRTCAAVSIMAMLILAGAVSPCFGEDLVCFDSGWGALFRYDPQTGDREVLSGFGMGSELVGDGPMWRINPYIMYTDQRLTTGPEGTVYLTERLDPYGGVTVFAVDPITGNRTTFVMPNGERWANLLPDPQDADKVIVFAYKEAYELQERNVYELTRSTGQFQEIPSDLAFPPGRYNIQVPDVMTTVDAYGYTIVLGHRVVNGEKEYGPFIYSDVRYPPVRKMSSNLASNVCDIHFDPARNRVFIMGKWEMCSAPMILPSFYGPFELMPDPSDSLRRANGLCSWNGLLVGIVEDEVVEIDPDMGQITPLPKGGPVGFGIAAPDQGILLDSGRLLTCEPGKILWHDLNTQTTQEVPADIEPGTIVADETSDSVYLLESTDHGAIKRYDKLAGTTDVLMRGSALMEIQAAAVIDETHIVYVGESTWEAGCYVRDLMTGEDTQIFSEDHCSAVRRAGQDSVFVSWNDTWSGSITQVWLDGRSEQVCRHTPGGIYWDAINSFVLLSDEEVFYFTATGSNALWGAEMGSDHSFIVSGTGDDTIHSIDEWVGQGVSWGRRLYLYGIQDGYAYVGDWRQDGIFRVDLLTGERVLISAEEYFPWRELDGIGPYIPEPACLSLLAAGAFVLIRRRRKG